MTATIFDLPDLVFLNILKYLTIDERITILPIFQSKFINCFTSINNELKFTKSIGLYNIDFNTVQQTHSPDVVRFIKKGYDDTFERWYCSDVEHIPGEYFLNPITMTSKVFFIFYFYYLNIFIYLF